MTSSAAAEPQRYLEAQIRWRPLEIVFWLATLLPFVLTPNYLVLASQIAITALFALSLDLILGYAGIVSLGHAAYFGFGVLHRGPDREMGLGRTAQRPDDRRRRRRPARISHEFHHRPLPSSRVDHDHARARPAARRGGQQCKLADRRRRRPAGRAHVEPARHIPVRSLRHDRLRLCARDAVPPVSGRAAADQLAVRPGAAWHPRKRRAHAGDRSAESPRTSARSTPSPPSSPAWRAPCSRRPPRPFRSRR